MQCVFSAVALHRRKIVDYNEKHIRNDSRQRKLIRKKAKKNVAQHLAYRRITWLLCRGIDGARLMLLSSAEKIFQWETNMSELRCFTYISERVRNTIREREEIIRTRIKNNNTNIYTNGMENAKGNSLLWCNYKRYCWSQVCWGSIHAIRQFSIILKKWCFFAFSSSYLFFAIYISIIFVVCRFIRDAHNVVTRADSGNIERILSLFDDFHMFFSSVALSRCFCFSWKWLIYTHTHTHNCVALKLQNTQMMRD